MSNESTTPAPIKNPIPSAGKKPIIIALAFVLLIFAGYFGYQWYQTKQYIEKVTPMYRTLDSLDKDLDKVITQGDGKLYRDLIKEAERIKRATQDLKLRYIEITPPTDQSKQISEAFIKAMDKLTDWSDATTAYLQADLNLITDQKHLDYLYDMAQNYYLYNYAAREYEKQVDKVKEARKKKESAEQRCQATRAYYQSETKPELEKTLGITKQKPE